MPQNTKATMGSDRFCSVCNEKIKRHECIHYGALSCYSCRAFFRRLSQKSAMKATAKLECRWNRGKKDEPCTINERTRKHCRKCRYSKCLSVGMCPDQVLSGDQKARRFRTHNRRVLEVHLRRVLGGGGRFTRQDGERVVQPSDPAVHSMDEAHGRRTGSPNYQPILVPVFYSEGDGYCVVPAGGYIREIPPSQYSLCGSTVRQNATNLATPEHYFFVDETGSNLYRSPETYHSDLDQTGSDRYQSRGTYHSDLYQTGSDRYRSHEAYHSDLDQFSSGTSDTSRRSSGGSHASLEQLHSSGVRRSSGSHYEYLDRSSFVDTSESLRPSLIQDHPDSFGSEAYFGSVRSSRIYMEGLARHSSVESSASRDSFSDQLHPGVSTRSIYYSTCHNADVELARSGPMSYSEALNLSRSETSTGPRADEPIKASGPTINAVSGSFSISPIPGDPDNDALPLDLSLKRTVQ